MKRVVNFIMLLVLISLPLNMLSQNKGFKLPGLKQTQATKNKTDSKIGIGTGAKSTNKTSKNVLKRRATQSGNLNRKGAKAQRTKLDYEKYSIQLEKAAAGGDSNAQFALALMYLNGEGGVEQSERQMIYWMEKAANNGHLDAQTGMGLMWENGIGVDSVDVYQAFNWYQKAADRGEPAAQFLLANLYRSTAYYLDDVSDQNEAFENAYNYYIKSANQDNAQAMYKLGLMYANGEYVTANDNKAREWFEKGAILDDDDCVYGMGIFYGQGRGGLNQDNEMAYKCFKWAAEQGNDMALNKLGFCYQKGIGCIQDEKKAIDCYAKAGNNGETEARYNWAYCTYFGIGIDRPNEQAAIEVMEEIATKGYMDAVDFMTEYQKEYFKGEGMVTVTNYKPKNSKRCNIIGKNSTLRVIGVSYDDTFIRIDFEDDCSQFMWASISRDTWIKDNFGGMSQLVYAEKLRIAPNLSYFGSDVNTFRFSLYFYRQTIKGYKIDFAETGSDWIVNDIILPTKKDKDVLVDIAAASLSSASSTTSNNGATAFGSMASNNDITSGIQVNRLISTDIQDWVLKSVERRTGSTVFHWRVTDRCGGSFAYMTNNVYLVDERTNKKYYMTVCDGLPFGSENAVILKSVGEYRDYSVYFPELPSSVNSVTYYGSEDLVINGIQLSK